MLALYDDFYTLQDSKEELLEVSNIDFKNEDRIVRLANRKKIILSVVVTRPLAVKVDDWFKWSKFDAERTLLIKEGRATKIESSDTKQSRLQKNRLRLLELDTVLAELEKNITIEGIRPSIGKQALLADISSITAGTGSIIIRDKSIDYYLVNTQMEICTVNNSTIGFRKKELKRLLLGDSGNTEHEKPCLSSKQRASMVRFATALKKLVGENDDLDESNLIIETKRLLEKKYGENIPKGTTIQNHFELDPNTLQYPKQDSINRNLELIFP